MSESPPVLTYATPRQGRQRRPWIDWSGRILGPVQLVAAVVLTIAAPSTFDCWGASYSEGSRSAQVALYWLAIGVGPLNLAAAALAIRGSYEPLDRPNRFYRRYAWAVVAGLA